MNWNMLSVDDWNRRNPCCCAMPPCPLAEVEIEHRDLEECRYGFEPFFKSNTPEDTDPEPWPDAFDPYGTPGDLIPVYKLREEQQRQQLGGVVTLEAKLFGTGDVEVDSFTYTATTAFDETVSRGAEYQKELHEWPAGNYPLGVCPPEISELPPAAPGSLSATVGTPADGLVPVVLGWMENRSTYVVDGDTYRYGFYQVMLDGESPFDWDGDSFEIHLTEGDETCHEFRVRAVCGSPGQWSEPKVFSLTGNPCCEPEPLPCNFYTEGNYVSSVTQDARNKKTGTWTAGTESGTFDECDMELPTDPTELGLIWKTVVYLMPSTLTDSWETRVPSRRDQVAVKVVNEPNPHPSPDPTDHSWQLTDETATGSLSITPPGGTLIPNVAEISTISTVLSVDQNSGETTAEAMFAAVAAEAAALDDSWGWGMTISGYDWPDGASAPAHWPVIGDAAMGRVLRCRYRQIRVRFAVADAHTGTVCRTVWNLARFSDQWLVWKGEYYTWAVAKYAYLHKPAPGDPDYPVLADFSEAENPADALAAAIAAIDAITDPGDAPAEPVDLRPVVIGEPNVWDWTIAQTEGPFETIPDCDPTKAAREIVEPTPPAPLGESPTPEEIEAHDAAVAAYEAALADYNAAVAKTARQSPWFIVSPDRYSRELTKPVAPTEPDPLGESPTPEEIAAHELATTIYLRKLAEYEAMLAIWEDARRESIQICDVATICSPNSPYGPVPNYDPNFLTTTLPALDPATANPTVWAAWWT